ncbi:hypothetical protein Q7P37_010265 [Cladosporium fusiforme]
MATEALRVVLGTTVSEALGLTGLDAVGDASFAAAAVSCQRDGTGETALRCGIGVAAEEIPGLEALSGEERLFPAIIRDDGEAVAGAAFLRLVALAGHAALGFLGGGGWESVAAPTLEKPAGREAEEVLAAEDVVVLEVDVDAVKLALGDVSEDEESEETEVVVAEELEELDVVAVNSEAIVLLVEEEDVEVLASMLTLDVTEVSDEREEVELVLEEETEVLTSDAVVSEAMVLLVEAEDSEVLEADVMDSETTELLDDAEDVELLTSKSVAEVDEREEDEIELPVSDEAAELETSVEDSETVLADVALLDKSEDSELWLLIVEDDSVLETLSVGWDVEDVLEDEIVEDASADESDVEDTVDVELSESLLVMLVDCASRDVDDTVDVEVSDSMLELLVGAVSTELRLEEVEEEASLPSLKLDAEVELDSDVEALVAEETEELVLAVSSSETKDDDVKETSNDDEVEDSPSEDAVTEASSAATTFAPQT